MRLVAAFAFAGGVAAANLYYIQPLLDVIGDSFDVSTGSVGALAALVQLGYLLGLAFLVPLGDLHERRRLITVVLALATAAAVLCSAAPNFPILAGALVILGSLSVVTQIIVPLASSLAPEAQRGQIIGWVMSGMMTGILAGRICSGLIGELAGWRAVYVFAAGMMLIVIALLRWALPVSPAPAGGFGYRQSLRSVLTLVREEPVLRQRMAIAATGFSGFAILWSAITFLLAEPPYEYREATIGLVSLAGIAAILISPVSGRLADRGHARLALTVFLLILAASWGVMAVGRDSIFVLLLGVVMFNLGMQGAQINAQTAIYALRPEARGRLTTAYLTAVFTGMVVGAALSGVIYEVSGWYGICAVAGTLGVIALAIWIGTRNLGEADSAAVGGPWLVDRVPLSRKSRG